MTISLWERQQERTFLEWVNHYLELKQAETYETLEILIEKDGILKLLEVIFEKKLFKYKTSVSPFLRLENYNKALNILGQPFGIVASNLVFNNDKKMAVSFLWHIIQKYNLTKFFEQENPSKIAVYEFNDPLEPIKYWENDVDEEISMSEMDPEKYITLHNGIAEWTLAATQGKVELDDLIYCTSEKDTRLLKFALFAKALIEETFNVEENKIDLKEIEEFLEEQFKEIEKQKRSPEVLEKVEKEILKQYLKIQKVIEEKIQIPQFSIIFSTVSSENQQKLFNINEQSFIAYLCTIRDNLHRRKVEEKGEEDLPPKLILDEKFEIIDSDDKEGEKGENKINKDKERMGKEEREEDKEMIKEIDRKLKNGNKETFEALSLTFEEFVNYLEPEIKPLAYKLKSSYDIKITRINEYLEIIKMEEEQRRLRDKERRERQRFKIEMEKKNLESDKNKMLLDYKQKLSQNESLRNYLEKKKELESLQKQRRKHLIRERKDLEIQRLEIQKKKERKAKTKKRKDSNYDQSDSSSSSISQYKEKEISRSKKKERENYEPKTKIHSKKERTEKVSHKIKHHYGSSESESQSESLSEEGNYSRKKLVKKPIKKTISELTLEQSKSGREKSHRINHLKKVTESHKQISYSSKFSIPKLFRSSEERKKKLQSSNLDKEKNSSSKKIVIQNVVSEKSSKKMRGKKELIGISEKGRKEENSNYEIEKEILYFKGSCKNCSNLNRLKIKAEDCETIEEFEALKAKEIPYIKIICNLCEQSSKIKIYKIKCFHFDDSEKRGKEKEKEEKKDKEFENFKITVHGAKYLDSKHLFGKSASPFAEVNFMGGLKKTKIKYNTLAPAFNSSFNYNLGGEFLGESILNVIIRDSDGNKYLGSREFKLKEIREFTKKANPYKSLFELTNGKGAVIGLSFQFW